MRISSFLLLFVLTLTSGYSSAQLSSTAADNKASLYFIAFANNSWKVITKVLSDGQYQTIDTDTEPRSACFSESKQELVYIGVDDSLRHRVLDTGSEKIIYQPKHKESISQLFCSHDLDRLFVMYMPEGKSSAADIAEIKNGKLSVTVKQLSSQFEPYLHNSKWLYYGHVHCLVDCGRIIREVWRKNTISREAKQITLTGSITRNHSTDQRGEWLYFSSNRLNNYAIWRQSLKDDSLEQVTQGDNNDSFPVVDTADNLYFIRHPASSQAPELMQLNTNDELNALKLPEDITDIRNLRITH